MREILFRGKRIDNGEWIHGFLVIYGDDYYIAPDINAYTAMGGRGKGRCMLFGHYYQVISETIGQYTGLTDKNGKKIFEGDIVRETITSYYQPIGKIYYDTKNCQLRIEYVNDIVSVGHIGDGRIYELLGNIYDTPMLLEDNP